MTRRKKTLRATEEAAHLSVIVPASLLVELDEEAALLADELGVTVRRSDAVKKALREWVNDRRKAREVYTVPLPRHPK